MPELKSFEPVFKEATREGTARFVVATLHKMDSDRDVTLPGFFGRQTVHLLPAHDWTHVPLGKGVLFEQGDEVLVDVKFNLSIPAARDWYEAVKFDVENPPSLQEYSYGYSVKEGGARRGEHNGERVRILGPLKDGSPGVVVHEVSAVLLGAGVGTHTVAVKQDPGRGGLDAGTQADLEREYLRFVARNLTKSVQEAEFRAELSRAFRRVAIDYSADLTGTVPSSTREAAKAAVGAYAGPLGIDPEQVVIRWFSEEDDPEFVEFSNLRPLLGICHPKADSNTIWLRSDLDEADAWSIAAHELRHLAAGDEAEAEVFEIKARMEWATR